MSCGYSQIPTCGLGSAIGGWQRKWTFTVIGQNETTGQLHDRLATLGAEAIFHVLTQLARGRDQASSEQASHGITCGASILAISEIQRPGGTRMAVSAWIKGGGPAAVGERFGFDSGA